MNGNLWHDQLNILLINSQLHLAANLFAMTTTFLDLPQQVTSCATSSFLSDDVDIIEPNAPSLFEVLASRYSAMRQKLPWTASMSPYLLPSCCLISWHHLRDALVVADSNKLHIYRFTGADDGKGGWLNPIITPARPIKSVAWSPLSNTLVVGSNDGLYLWRLPSLDNAGVKASSCMHLPPPSSLLVSLASYWGAAGAAADLLTVSPQGRLVCTVLSAASDQRTLGQQLCLWDMHTPLAARALNCSVGGRITCVQWSPSGQFLAVGGSSGCVVLVDTESWEQTPVCQVDGGGGGGGGGGGHGGVQQLCWVSAVDCVMVQQQQQQQGAEGQGQGGLVYTLHLPDSGGGDRDRDLAETSAIHDTQVSSLPLNLLDNRLKNLLFTFCLDKKLIDDPGGDDQEPAGSFYVADIVTDNLKSDYLAVSFAYSPASSSSCKSFKLPFVCLYLCSTRPHLAATFLSIIDNNQTACQSQSSSTSSTSSSTPSDGLSQLIYPLEVRFNHLRQHHRAPAQLWGLPGSADNDRDTEEDTDQGGEEGGAHQFGAHSSFSSSSTSMAVPVQLAIRWSNKVVSVSPCHTHKED